MPADSQELYRTLLKSLTLSSAESEKRAILIALLEPRLGMGPSLILAGSPTDLEAEFFNEDIKRLNSGEPVQYVVGKAPFMDRWFNVTASVLIPRPETELLAELVITRLGKKTSGIVLDIGTGSGCLAITLALERPDASVFATDVSENVLSIAKGNAVHLKAAVKFFKSDVLTEELPVRSLDVVMSNPPYIRLSEKPTLGDNVVHFEPEMALFVPDDDPLVFHRAIAQKAMHSLNPGGLLAMEINEKLGPETVKLLETENYVSIELHRDLDGRDRFVSAIKS